jgi:undecaprenyl-diphosphatase
LLFRDAIAALFNSPPAIGTSMLLMGMILYITKFSRGDREIGVKAALFVGAAQALALMPGISRSGATIAAGLSRHINRQKAFLFSFMLSIPAVVGANVYELYKTGSGGVAAMGIETVAAVAVAAVAGYGSIRLLKKVFESRRLHMFAYYCWAVGLAVVAYSYLFL